VVGHQHRDHHRCRRPCIRQLLPGG
jgi:hypothetical protein